jgi:quinol monooxygenase YgiN
VDEFVAQMQRLQATLQAQPGCLQAMVLTQCGGPGRFNVLTWVAWKDQASVDQAAAAMQRQFAAEGFDPNAFLQRLGAEPDLGVYRAAT